MLHYTYSTSFKESSEGEPTKVWLRVEILRVAVHPVLQVIRGQSLGPDVEICYFAREAVGVLKVRQKVLAQSELLDYLPSVEMLVLQSLHQVVLHVGHTTVVEHGNCLTTSLVPSQHSSELLCFRQEWGGQTLAIYLAWN